MDCSKCGKSLDADAKCCVGCGISVTPMDTTEEEPTGQREQRLKRPQRMVLFGVGAIAFAAVAAGVGVALLSSGHGASEATAPAKATAGADREMTETSDSPASA